MNAKELQKLAKIIRKQNRAAELVAAEKIANVQRRSIGSILAQFEAVRVKK